MPGTHIIRRQVLEVAVAGTESDGFALQRRLPEMCQHGLMPALDRVLERLVPAHEHWIVDRLEVDAGTLSFENLERDLVEAVIQAITKLLRERAPTGTATGSTGQIDRRTEAQSVQEALLYFLQTGSLPWWFELPARKKLEDVVRASRGTAGQTEAQYFVHSTIEAIGSASVRKRLVQQFSADFLEMLLASVSPDAATAMHEVFAKLGKLDFASGAPRRFAEQLWQTAFAAVAAGKRPMPSTLVAECLDALPGAEPQDRALIERIALVWPEALSRGRAAEEKELRDGVPDDKARLRADGKARQADGVKEEEPTGRIDLKEGVYTRCAGLVLLHPFLPRFFEALGIAAEGRLVQPERALCLLHFLATGQRLAPEYELLLPKLLCNLPFEAPVESRIELTATEEEEAVALLGAVIRHWGALGDTSPDGLRGTFLARPGKLSRRDDGDDLLQVETQSFDILLDRLPWGIGAIQLPWMKKILWVEWRH